MNYNTGIYQIVNQVNGKRYIGSAVNLEQREISHFNTLTMEMHKNRYFQFAYNKYGKENFKFEPLLYCDKENLLFYEQKLLDSYNLKEELYNISPTAGSNLGMKFTDEHKKKIGDSNRGKKHTKETKEKISKILKGRIISPESAKKTAEKLRGRKRPPEVGKKISEGLKGKKLSKEHIEKIAKSKRGKKLKKEHREKISKTLTGRKLSKENKRKIGLANSGKNQHLYIHFTDEQLDKIEIMRKQGMSYKKISQKFNCSRKTISNKLKDYLKG